jgi:ubiquinone/menaquinone biosynthesis C-methylase UbiE
MSRAPHSEEYIADDRFGWWNEDFLRLLKFRVVGEAKVTRMCDFGVGEGHWSLGLSAVFDGLQEVTGVDRELEWCERSARKYAEFAPHIDYRTEVADATATSLPSDHFDVVTAQTVLMHSLAPEKIIAEMRRVSKPGGAIICVEPVNHLNWAQTLELTHQWSATERATFYRVWIQFLEFVRFNRGDQDVGLRLPTLFKRAGLRNIRAWSNDRVEIEPAGDFNLDFIDEEMGREQTMSEIIGAGISPDDLAFVRRMVKRTREERPREMDYIVRAPINVICVGSVF